MSSHTYYTDKQEIIYGAGAYGYFFSVYDKEPEPSTFGYTEEPVVYHANMDGPEMFLYLSFYHCPNKEHVFDALNNREF